MVTNHTGDIAYVSITFILYLYINEFYNKYNNFQETVAICTILLYFYLRYPIKAHQDDKALGCYTFYEFVSYFFTID